MQDDKGPYNDAGSNHATSTSDALTTSTKTSTPRVHAAERSTSPAVELVTKKKAQKEQNIPLGIVGAIIGSMAGGALIILLDRLGFVASVSGLVMAAATIFLYRKLAKGISIKGLVICAVIMVITVLLAENIAWSIAIVEELGKLGYDMTFGDVFNNFFKLLAEGYIDGGRYAGSLALVYFFTALGSFGVFKSYKL